jgi:hypothetical protein
MIELAINEVFDRYYNNIDDIEVIILKLKDLGLSQMESTKILIFKLNFSLKEADNFVINSKAWSDNYNSLIKFRENLIKSALESNIPDKLEEDTSI